MGVRADLAAAITAAVQPGHPRVQVYAHPEDVTQVPAIVLVPDDPWAEVGTFGGAGAGTLRWSFNVSMLAPRADVESAIELFEALRILIMEGIGNALPNPAKLTSEALQSRCVHRMLPSGQPSSGSE